MGGQRVSRWSTEQEDRNRQTSSVAMDSTLMHAEAALCAQKELEFCVPIAYSVWLRWQQINIPLRSL